MVNFSGILNSATEGALSPGMLAIVGMLVVFIGLVLLQFFVNIFHSILLGIEAKENKKRAKKIRDGEQNTNVSKEEAVAIALALDIYHRKFMAEHDYILTLKKYTKNVTPWKTGNMNGFPNVFKKSWR
ncbi:OadG family protein [candidate division WOR-3 bacterium]|nr:OadG family protein [candidate division WOR-3 bacterium]